MATKLKKWSFLAPLKRYFLTPREAYAFEPKMVRFGWPELSILPDLSFIFISWHG
jgi:hypothetical protein